MYDPTGISDPIPKDLSAPAGFMGQVYISRALSDRLEVPEDWQVDHSWNGRIFEVLVMASKAVKASTGGRITFQCVFPDNMTHRPEVIDLALDIDGDGDFVVDFEEKEGTGGH